MVGDDDGVVVVPRGSEERVLEIATEIERVEDRIVAEVLGGSTIAAARARHRYHLLQRADER